MRSKYTDHVKTGDFQWKFALLRNVCHSIDNEACVLFNARKLFVHIKQLNRFMKTALTGYGYEWAETQTERKRL